MQFDLTNPAHLGMIESLDRSGKRKMTDEERRAIINLLTPGDVFRDIPFKEAPPGPYRY